MNASALKIVSCGELDLAADPRTLFGDRVHLVGIGGTGMRSLASLLYQAGCQVSGTDQSPAGVVGTLPAAIQFQSAPGLPKDVDCLIHSSAVPQDDPDRVAATVRGVAQHGYAEVLGMLTVTGDSLAIAGTHGKSTTSALVAHLHMSADQPLNYCFGAEYTNGTPGGAWANAACTLVEACEFQRNFLNLRPTLAVVTNVEQDHFDCFANLSDSRAAFEQFLHRLPPNGTAIMHYDVAQWVQAEHIDRRTFSATHSAADYHATDIRDDGEQASFTLYRSGTSAGRFSIPLPGSHNVENALAAIMVAESRGLTLAEIRAGLTNFLGLQRRSQCNERGDEITRIDDYAHHPTAIAVTLTALRQRYPGRRIMLVFQPHQAERLRQLFGDFVSSLTLADQVAIMEVHRAREPNGLHPHIADELAAAVRAAGTPVWGSRDVAEISSAARVACREGDLLVTMSAGFLGKDRNGID